MDRGKGTEQRHNRMYTLSQAVSLRCGVCRFLFFGTSSLPLFQSRCISYSNVEGVTEIMASSQGFAILQLEGSRKLKISRSE